MSDREARGQIEATAVYDPGAEGQAGVPSLWSGHQLIAFSGLHGSTRWATAITGRILPTRPGLRFDTDPCFSLFLQAVCDGHSCDTLPGGGDASFAAVRSCRVDADRAELELELRPGGPLLQLLFAFGTEQLVRCIYRLTNPGETAHEVEVYAHLVTGVCPPGMAERSHREPGLYQLGLSGDWAKLDGSELPRDLDPHCAEQGASAVEIYRAGTTLAAGATTGGQLTISFRGVLGTPPAELLADAALSRLLADQPVYPTPDELAGLPPLLRRTRAKAMAILRANVFAPEGTFSTRWMVTQRIKHRNFNTYHAPFLAAGALAFDPELAADILRAALSQQQANGHVPEQSWPQGQSMETGPPLLCWAVWQVYRATGDKALLEEVVSRLKDYVKYPLATRLLERLGHARSNGAKFLTWGHGEGSNMDNSPRFDYKEPFAAVDFTSYCVAEIAQVAKIILELEPEHREAVHLAWMGDELAREIREYSWCEERGLFVDRYPDDDPVEARTVASLIPLFAGVASQEQADRTIDEHLLNPAEFWTRCPLASLAANDPRCDQNMWRGAVWPGINLLLCQGLRRYGRAELAEELREKTLENIARWYQRTGTLWEFYDSAGERCPAELPRGRRVGALPGYGWTAATYLALLHEAERD